MQTYTTQMDAARKGIITPEMEIVAKKEYRTTEEIRQWVAEGKVAIPANKHHKCLNLFPSQSRYRPCSWLPLCNNFM